eukprot:CAMPEP_0177574784 /NCGR_PEP_ID=MMETSP0369-20130122/79227_1 /TAXON_ID=447022 ORGANISM="Scrippsiella hangoei-like, Strain SHHI-4" /NCGR_SAMPLE_ID=MMETSP0369 /ASSEMBLY_ACC=CAM_ASM_000364 /LENGTH=46 /DNA_ID= /DNA_START= /DNA_END= /DNA_ORIENTATION=
MNAPQARRTGELHKWQMQFNTHNGAEAITAWRRSILSLSTPATTAC